MPSDRVIAILAGGAGRRLWPLSTVERPKQFVPLFEGKSMLQMTFERVSKAFGADDVLLVGAARHRDLYIQQLPGLREENLILEPEGRGTAAALALTASVCAETKPGAAVATIPSDHLIPNPDHWVNAIRVGLDFVLANDYLVCVGAPPRAGETKFGYMTVAGRLAGTDAYPLRAVERFVEKPDAETLDRLISKGACVRNMGTIIFRPDVLAGEMERLAPEVYQPVSRAARSFRSLESVYAKVPVRSVDEAVLRHSDHVAAVLGPIESNDAGDFVTLGDAIGRDEHGNASTGQVVVVDASDNTVLASDVTVALVGVEGLVVVVEGNRVLVCPAGEAQRIKQISP